MAKPKCSNCEEEIAGNVDPSRELVCGTCVIYMTLDPKAIVKAYKQDKKAHSKWMNLPKHIKARFAKGRKL